MQNIFLILDLETTSVDVNTAQIRVFGAYDPQEDKYYVYKWNDYYLAKVVELLNTYEYIITFNGLKYDLPILERHGVPTSFKHIDVRDVIKNKRSKMLRKFEHYSLKGISNDLKLDENGKGEIDYNVFKKENWTFTEQEQIIKYIKQDLLLTWKVWKYLLDRFAPLAKFIKEDDARKYKHITTNLDTYAYKVICNLSGVTELYDENPKDKQYPQVYSINPRRDKVKGLIAHLRFNNLYAHLIMQYNLLKHQCKCCESNEGKYHGKNVYSLKGYYCVRSQGPIEVFLKDVTSKAETNPTYKTLMHIIHNRIYSIMTNSKYYTTYNPDSVYDCYNLARQQGVALLRKFEEKGYYVIDMDEDDIFILVDESKGQTLSEVLIIKDDILFFLKSRMPYPSETFKLELVDEIRYLRFFGKGPVTNVFMRKGQYVYVDCSGVVCSKGVTADEVKQALA